jgi:hypothetical protein
MAVCDRWVCLDDPSLLIISQQLRMGIRLRTSIWHNLRRQGRRLVQADAQGVCLYVEIDFPACYGKITAGIGFRRFITMVVPLPG